MGKRVILAIGLFMVFMIFWNKLAVQMGLIQKVPVEKPAVETVENSQDKPPVLEQKPVVETANLPDVEPGEVIERETILLENETSILELTNVGGLITRATLKDYYTESRTNKNITLVASGRYYPGEIVWENGGRTNEMMFKVAKPNQNQVVFTHQRGDLEIIKTYTMEDRFKLSCSVEVNGAAPSQNFYFVVSDGLQPVLASDKLVPSFLDFGAISPKIMHLAWSESGDHEYKLPGKIDENQFQPVVKKEHPIEWLGVKDTYFANIFKPTEPTHNVFGQKQNLFLGNSDKPSAIPIVSLKAEQSVTGFFYIGPILENELAAIDPEISNLLTYGWAGLLSKWLFKALTFFHSMTGNWGWAIIILTLFIRTGMIPLTIPSVKSSYKMKKIQPKIEQLKKKHSGGDLESKQKLSQETFKLYKEEGVNPFSSCITALAQMPIFIAYFSLLRSSIQLRQAPWHFWIYDLSIKDPVYVMPILLGVLMFLSTLAMPMPGGDPAQQKMMKIMPVVFSLMFFAMPAGLVIYMITSTLFTLGQTHFLKWRYEKA